MTNNTINAPANEQFLRIATVIALTGLPRSSLYDNIKAGTFPAPVRIGKRAVAWPAESVRSWQNSCVQASKADCAQ